MVSGGRRATASVSAQRESIVAKIGDLLSAQRRPLEYSLLIQALVPLLEAHERAVHDGNDTQRRELADAICQGISPDAELFVNRVDLLAAYSMVEYLFTAKEPSGHVVYTPIGRRHVRLLEEYEARIARLAIPLHEDCQHFKRSDGAYSPYGAFFGVSSNLLEHMVLKPDAVTCFSLEDVFASGGADKVAWAGVGTPNCCPSTCTTPDSQSSTSVLQRSRSSAIGARKPGGMLASLPITSSPRAFRMGCPAARANTIASSTSCRPKYERDLLAKRIGVLNGLFAAVVATHKKGLCPICRRRATSAA